jgi:hypothetical protein
MRVDLRIAERDFGVLHDHLLQADRDEHGAILLAGFRRTDSAIELAVREVHRAEGDQFPPGVHGYRQLSPRFVAEMSGRAEQLELVYLSAHSHPGADAHVSFSPDDLDSHRRLFPHLLDITRGVPVGGLVFGERSAAGEIWLGAHQTHDLSSVEVIGPHLRSLRPSLTVEGLAAEPRFDRQARIFGEEGQRILRGLRVGVIGVGGGGSMLVEQLAHLGIGSLVLIDPDRVEETNLSRVVGAGADDVGRNKVDVAARLVERIDPSIAVKAIDGDVTELSVAERLLDADFLFLATDTASSRLVFNAIVHRYLIPGIQIGVKVELTPKTKRIADVWVAVRPVLPDRGCLACAGLIDPMRLQREGRTEQEAVAQDYLDTPEVIDPSVISLNGISASHAVTTMLFAFTGLGEESLFAQHLFFPLEGVLSQVEGSRGPDCRWCSTAEGSAYGCAGDPAELPCRRNTPETPTPRRRRSPWTRVRDFLSRAT